MKQWGNMLLAALPPATLALFEHDLSHVALPQNKVCFDAGDPIQHVYFPTSGLISLVLSTKDGDLIEAGMVGREGAAGLQSAFGRRISFARAVVQIAGTVYTIPVEPLRRAIDQSEQARQVVYRYTEVLLAESQRLAACNAVHHGESRLARWLLQAADRTGTDRLALTQEFLGEMLALRRTSVTLLAQALQDRDLIRYSRGKITILDRKALADSACECYHVIQELYRELYSHPTTLTDVASSI